MENRNRMKLKYKALLIPLLIISLLYGSAASAAVAKTAGGEVINRTPFQFPLCNMYETICESSDFYSYRLDSSRGRITADGDISDIMGMTPFMEEYVVPASGHPAGTIYAWVMNDDQNLYLAFDVTPDNTMDGDQDYVKVYIKTSGGVRIFKVSVPETTWGRPGFTYTSRVGYQHKVYEFEIPLSELGVRAGEERLISLAFAAYGTMAAPPPVSFRPAVNYYSGGQPYGISTGDFDHDGKLDIASVNSNNGNLSVLFGRGDGTFDDRVTIDSGYGSTWVATGDYNDDSNDDLAVICSAGVAVLLSNGNRTFAPPVTYTAGTSPNTVVAADFNKDGKEDLAVSNYNSNNVTILAGNGNGTFALPANIGVDEKPARMVAADIDNDSFIDLAVVCGDRFTSSSVVILKGDNTGNFTILKRLTNIGDTADVYTIGIVASDFNNDEKHDLALTQFENSPNFENSGFISVLYGPVMGDSPDLRNYTVNNEPLGISPGDFNCDGLTDLSVANVYDNNIAILTNAGYNTFMGKQDFAVDEGPRITATGDFNGDGKLDLAVTTNENGKVSVLINRFGVTDVTAPTWPAGGALVASEIASRSLTLTWPAADDDTAVTEYKVFYNGKEKVVAGDVHSMNLPNLTPGQISVFKMEAADAAGNWSSTGPVTISVTKPEGSWLDATAANFHGQAIAGDGTLWGWGQNSVGQIGDNTTLSKRSPTAANAGNQWDLVCCGDAHSLALKSDGTLWSWGDNTFGQVGINSAAAEQHRPAQVGGGANWVNIGAGYQFSAGIQNDGSLWTWGRNAEGKLGNGTVINAKAPVRVGTDTDWVSVSLGTSHALALKKDGSLWSWGFNGMGQLGLGKNGDGSIAAGVKTPVRVGTDTDWIAISAGEGFSLALKSDGTLWAWGDNTYGILGKAKADAFWAASPVRVGAGTNWALMEAGVDHVLAIQKDGTLWAWGNNYSGQLGNTFADNQAVFTPSQIGADTKWCRVSAGHRDSYALKADGTLWVWGQNNIGQLGDGTTTLRRTPVEVTANLVLAHGSIQFDCGSLGTYEGANSTITVKRVGGKDGVVTVDYTTVDGTALAGTHYVKTSGTLTWADGNDADKTIPYSILNDSSYNGYLDFSCVLSNPTGDAVLGAEKTLPVTISDNDNPPVPGGLRATAGNGRVSLRWDSVKSAYYKLYFSTVSGEFTEGNSVGVYDANTYTMTGLTNGTKYYFAIRAGHNIYFSQISAQVAATPAVPVDDGTPAALPVKVIEVGTDTTITTTVPPIQGGDGIVRAFLNRATGDLMLREAIKAFEKEQSTVVEVKTLVSFSTKGTIFTIPGGIWRGIAGKTDAQIRVNAGYGMITFDERAVDTISDAAQDGDITIRIDKVDPESLPQKIRARVNDRPVFNFGVMAGKTAVTHLRGGKAKISIPYTPKSGEKKNAIVAYSIHHNGKVKVMIGRYYEQTGTVDFETTNLNSFALGYHRVVFGDVQFGAWYQDAVYFFAGREITTGTLEGYFSPNMKLTRGQFVVMLMRAYDIEPESAQTDNFSDAGNTWYTDYLSAAKGLHISSGVGGNRFAPEKEITRQEMFTLVYNALKMIEKVPATSGSIDINVYRDAGQVSVWAKEAITALVQAGIINGSDNCLYPNEATTRAEMAQVLYNLLMR